MTITISGEKKEKKRFECSKLILVFEALVLITLLVCKVRFQEIDFDAIIVAWITSMGISIAAYYWKAKTENRVKVPMAVITSLPEEVRKDLDITQVITAIIQAE